VVRLELWLDASSIELVGDDGLVTVTDLAFAPAHAGAATVSALGGEILVERLAIFDLEASA
jgi:sucrose-6-phosphate hydrolase SacC (GH32 family)